MKQRSGTAGFVRYSLFVVALLSTPGAFAVDSFDRITLFYLLNKHEAAALFENTQLVMPDDHVDMARRNKQYRASAEYQAREDILSALSNEYRYSDRDGSLKGAERKRQHTLAVLSEHLSPADQATFKQNFIHVRDDQKAWKKLLASVRGYWITEPVTDAMEPALYRGVEGGSKRYVTFINNWAKDYQKAGGSASRDLALRWNVQIPRVYDRGPGARRFLENLMNMVHEGKLKAVPANPRGH